MMIMKIIFFVINIKLSLILPRIFKFIVDMSKFWTAQNPGIFLD